MPHERSAQDVRIGEPGAHQDLLQRLAKRLERPVVRGMRSASLAGSFVSLGIVLGDEGAFVLQWLVGIAKSAKLTFPADVMGAGAAKSVPDEASHRFQCENTRASGMP